MEEQPQCTLSVDSNSAASKRKGKDLKRNSKEDVMSC